MGATGFAYDLARQFGLKVVEPRPALVPLTLGGDDVLFRELSGIAAPVEATRGQGRVPRGRAVHPPRPVRPRDPPGQQLLAPRRARDDRPACPMRRRAGCSTPNAAARAPRCAPRSARCSPTASPKRSPNASRFPANSARRPTASSPMPRRASRAGFSARTAPKASPKPRSPSAESRPQTCHRKQ